jgi:hypothetical protein
MQNSEALAMLEEQLATLGCATKPCDDTGR